VTKHLLGSDQQINPQQHSFITKRMEKNSLKADL